MVDLKGFLIYLRNLLHLGCVQYNHDQLHKPSQVLSALAFFRLYLVKISHYTGTHWRSILNSRTSVDWNARQRLRAKSCGKTYKFSQFLSVSDRKEGRMVPLPLVCHTYWCTLQYPFWIFLHHYTASGSNSAPLCLFWVLHLTMICHFLRLRRFFKVSRTLLQHQI